MAVKIGDIVHHTPVQKWDGPEGPLTECGLPFDMATHYKTSEITCLPCRQGQRARAGVMGAYYDQRARALGWTDDEADSPSESGGE